MSTIHISRALTTVCVWIIFWIVFGFSLFLSDDLDYPKLLFAFAKSLVVSGIAWILLLVVNDTIVKSMVAAAKEKKADRFKGGMSYHMIEPTREEKAWQDQHRDEIEAAQQMSLKSLKGKK